MNTTQYIYQNEVRDIQITTYLNTHISFEPSGAYYTVYDEDATEVVTETLATVNGNNIQATINTTVSATPGKYIILWKIYKLNSIIKHKTRLQVLTLLSD